MGFKFRKSIKLDNGIKLNLNKKSFGFTFGEKGFKHTVNSSGRRTTTVGLGNGLSYSSSKGGGKNKSEASSQVNVAKNCKSSEILSGIIKSCLLLIFSYILGPLSFVLAGFYTIRTFLKFPKYSFGRKARIILAILCCAIGIIRFVTSLPKESTVENEVTVENVTEENM